MTTLVSDKYIVKFDSDYLFSRSAAAEKRKEIVDYYLFGNTTLWFDFSNVKSVSESYADELFGVLAATKGLDFFLDHVKVQTSKNDIAEALAIAIDRRCSSSAAA